ncbi:hypothetical protein Y695_04311 [Hydrogenophaga sp. T4]|nr:hypothetical protein Y695_04311 [Hydrogenophaga sp. T4]
MPLETMRLLVLRPRWIILVPVSACWKWLLTAIEWNSPRESSPRSTTLGYFQVMADPVSICVQAMCERWPAHRPRLVTKL